MRKMGKRLNIPIASLLVLFTAFVMTNCGSGGGSSGGSFSPSDSIPEPVAGAPSAPSNVTASPGIRQVTINWDLVDGADSYNIYWSTDPTIAQQIPINNMMAPDVDTSLIESDKGVMPPYVHTSLTNGTDYYYGVTAVSSSGESKISPEDVVNAMPTFGNEVLKKLLASDGDTRDFFSYSVAIDGDYAVVGAYGKDGGPGNTLEDAGAAYIFHRTDENGWDSVTKITAPDAEAFDYFGYSVAISGDYVIIGAYDKQVRGPLSGAAYIFHRTGENAWDNVTKITASDIDVQDFFGWSVAISGDYAIVGAHREDAGGSDTGAAYIFQRTGINTWDEEVTKIVASDPDSEDYFGYSVAISGDYAIVGAYREDTGGSDSGAAYIFHKNIPGENNWDEVAKIKAPDPVSSDNFGWSVAIDKDYAVVGAYLKDGDPVTQKDAGAAYIFHRTEDGTWDNSTKIIAPDAGASDLFGYSVAISGDFVIVGARADDEADTNAGAAYIFHRTDESTDENTWDHVTKIMASTPEINAVFGHATGISGSYAIVGAHQEDGGPGSTNPDAGAAYLY